MEHVAGCRGCRGASKTTETFLRNSSTAVVKPITPEPTTKTFSTGRRAGDDTSVVLLNKRVADVLVVVLVLLSKKDKEPSLGLPAPRSQQQQEWAVLLGRMFLIADDDLLGTTSEPLIPKNWLDERAIAFDKISKQN